MGHVTKRLMLIFFLHLLCMFALSAASSLARSSKKEIMPFKYKWSLKDYPKKNGLKVFTTFACGGSSMGYKLAGYGGRGSE